MHGLIQHLRDRWFLLGLGLMLVVGFRFCDPLEGLTRSSLLQNGVVVAVMFLMALPLSFHAFVQSIRRPVPAMLAVCMNSGVTPLLAWGAAILLAMMARDAVVGQELAMGLLVAGATPCTLASAAVWTRRAGGNEAVAVLGTILTNLACFVVMPFWLLTTTGQTIERPFGDMALKLLLLIVAPTVAAQLLRLNKPLAQWATANKITLSTAAQIGILFTVLTGAISAGLKLEGDAWRLLGWETGSMIFAVMSVHLVALFSGMGVSFALRQTREDSIAVGIAGSQKTLMVGMTIAYNYFGGLAVLPIIVYHCGQLLADTLVADWLRQRGAKLAARESTIVATSPKK